MNAPSPYHAPRVVPPVFIDRIVGIRRGRLTYSGNPTYVVQLESGTHHRIEPDAAANYDVQNPEFQHPNRVRIFRNSRNLIERLEVVTDEPADPAN